MTYPEVISNDPEDIFNGEREIGTRLDEFPKDHIGRYMFARSLMNRQTRALDIGCGVGYGSHFLSEIAGTVIGMDYRPKVVDYARRNWGNPNLTFQVGNALDGTTYPDQKFDFVTAFEIIEHLPDDELFLKLIKDHLNEQGIACISAPNLEVLTHPEDNPWHFRHYTPETFRSLLLKYFTKVALFGQRAKSVTPGSLGGTNVAVAYDTWPRQYSIGFVSREYPAPQNANVPYPPSGGIGTYTQILAQAFAARGHQVHVFTKGSDGAANEVYREHNVTVHRLSEKSRASSYLRRRLNFFRLTREALRRMLAVRAALKSAPSLDLIETADWYAETLLSHTDKTRNTVWITRLHTPSFVVRRYNNTKATFDDGVLDWFEKLNVHVADAITAPSRAIAEICSWTWRLNPIEEMHNLLPVSVSADISGKDTLAIGYLPGRFDTYKGFPTLARALVDVLPGSGNRLQFVLLGSDYTYGESKALLQTLAPWIDDGTGTRPVTLLPRKKRAETQELTKGLDAVLVTSRFENAPYVVLEAMASAKLVIAPRIGGLPEMIEDGQTGWLFEPDSPSSLVECLKHLAALNKAEIAEVRNRAWQAARDKFGLDRLAPLYEVYYAHLIGQKTQGIRRQRPVAWWLPGHGPLLPGWWHAWRQRARK